MKTSEVHITHPVGLHARPAKIFVQTAQQYKSKVTVTYKEKTVNAKSLLSLLSVGAGTDAHIVISADGEDESEALLALEALVKTNFGE